MTQTAIANEIEVVPTVQVKRAIEECRLFEKNIERHEDAIARGWMTGPKRLVEEAKKRGRLKDNLKVLLAALEAAGERPAKSTLMPAANAFIKSARTLNRFLGTTQRFSQHRFETIFWLIDYNQEE
ncbi:MAG: hypothetical protein K2Y39_08095 [Candidatus Obscuribacterales bacterium]|nr:hypothetical protein [Candidatus Obscuribacterales bacterium]